VFRTPPTEAAVGNTTLYRVVETDERLTDGDALRACIFFQTNAATANRMILRMIDFLSGVEWSGVNRVDIGWRLSRHLADSKES